MIRPDFVQTMFPLTILFQNFFFTLFDSSMKVSLYLGVTAAASLAGGIFLLVFYRSYNPANERLRNTIVYCSVIAVLLLWSLWALASATASSAAAGFGLPVLWLTYLVPNLAAAASGILLGLAFVRGSQANARPIENVGNETRIEKPSGMLPRITTILGIADLVLAGWTLLYTILYSLGVAAF